MYRFVISGLPHPLGWSEHVNPTCLHRDVRIESGHVTLHVIQKPYLLMVGDTENPRNAKTAFGLKQWTPESCLGQLRLSPSAVDIGLPDMSIAQAAAAGAKTLVIGIAPPGGQLPKSWYPVLVNALEAGMDVAAGLHSRLSQIPEIAERAAELGRRIHDVRQNEGGFPIATGKRRPGRRLLTVGTDCASGKKYTALALASAMTRRGWKADFRATGQTGILISGSGVAIDAVIADFVAGAAETLSPANALDHWDVIEGQGSLFHPAYAGVTLSLLHGSQPDALVLCHDPTRRTLNEFPQFPLVPLPEAAQAYLAAARLTNADARLVGAALDTSKLSIQEADGECKRTEDLLGVPCVDPIRTGVDQILNALESSFR
jgi:uncharacterized NAD-dependent epimerase/dehydratase family protein